MILFYIPEGTKFGFSNPREQSLSVIVMGFRLKDRECTKIKRALKIANTDEVNSRSFRVMDQRPSFSFLWALLKAKGTGLQRPARSQACLLWILHRGNKQPSPPQGWGGDLPDSQRTGDIVAGETGDGKELRHFSEEGDIYFFAPNTLIGFYSANQPDEEHAQILAVRLNIRATSRNNSGYWRNNTWFIS